MKSKWKRAGEWLLGVALAVIVLLLAPLTNHAATTDDYVRAIYLVEGGGRARVPYGVLSVVVRDRGEARAVCARTVRHSHARWEAAGCPGAFVDWLASTYCPRSADPVGWANWRRNLRAILKKHCHGNANLAP